MWFTSRGFRSSRRQPYIIIADDAQQATSLRHISDTRHRYQPLTLILPTALVTRPGTSITGTSSAILRQAQPSKHSSAYTHLGTTRTFSILRPPVTMCLITTPRKGPRYYDDAPPRPISNYHSGPHYSHAPNGYGRRSISRTRVIATEPRRSGRSVDYGFVRTEPRRSGRSVDVVRTSRTYVR